MLSEARKWTPLGLVLLGIAYSPVVAAHKEYEHHHNISYTSTVSCRSPVTLFSSGTPVIKCGSSSSVRRPSTRDTTWHTSHTTRTKHPDTSTTTIHVTKTKTRHPTSISRHPTYTQNTTITTTVQTTITTPCTTPTPTSVFDPCPTACSMSAGTVSVVFWPTHLDRVYPSTYVEPELDYTFTSPSVYLIIPTIFGTNSLGRTPPSASSTIWPFNLDEVSTIVPGSDATRQLSLSDLGTDCPRTAEASAIATMVGGGSCDPILAAPSAIRSWAWPCNACGRFGLFDPPYAVPTITGSLIEVTSTTEAQVTPTSAPVVTPPPTVVQPTPTTAAPTTVQTALGSRELPSILLPILGVLASIVLF